MLFTEMAVARAHVIADEASNPIVGSSPKLGACGSFGSMEYLLVHAKMEGILPISCPKDFGILSVGRMLDLGDATQIMLHALVHEVPPGARVSPR
jgi:hypothetical protein